MADWKTQLPPGVDPTSVHYWACSYLDADQKAASARRVSALVDSDDDALNTWLSRYSASPNIAKGLVTLTRASPTSVLTFDCKTNPLGATKASSLPPIDPTPLNVVKVIDGDTLHVTAPGSEEILKLRFVLINTPECRKGAGSSYERCPAILDGAEVGADEARVFLEQLVADYGNTVYYRSLGEDSYGRKLSLVYVKNPSNGEYIDVNLALVRAGRAHVYFIAPAETGFEEQYLAAQESARREGLGIWQLDRFKSPLVFSSFHGTAHNPDTAAEKEYLRLFNVSDQPMELAGYQLNNGDQTYTLPSFVLPPGYGVKIYTHYGTTSDDTSQELSINLALGRASWDKDSPMILMDRFGKTIAAHATNAEARKSLPNQ